MSKYYNVEVKLGSKKWTLNAVFTKQEDAMHYVKENSSETMRYPMRIVRVIRTIVFDGSK